MASCASKVPLSAAGVKYGSRNVLTDPDLRDAIKTFSQWPTVPQVCFTLYTRPLDAPCTPCHCMYVDVAAKIVSCVGESQPPTPPPNILRMMAG